MCGAAPNRTLFRCAFDEDPIRSVLFHLYPAFDEHELERLSGAEYVLEQCGSCTLIWQRAAPAGELLTRIYDVWGGEDAGLKRQDTLEYHRGAAEEILLVLEMLNRPPSEISVLDFGMGWGRWPRLAAGFGCRAFGVDFAAEQAEYAAEQGIGVFTLDELPDSTFDFINNEQVFEHLVDPPATLTRLARSLAPDGWLKITVPLTHDIERRLQRGDWKAPRRTSGSLYAVAPLEHLNLFNTRSLDALAERAGLLRDAPDPRAMYASTVGLWPPRALARGVARPPLRRLRPRAGFFRHAARKPVAS